MTFWSQATDPKRRHLFKVNFGNADYIEPYYLKTCTKPSQTINATEHDYLNHKYYYPGKAIWNDVSMTFIDLEGGTAVGLKSLLSSIGYQTPADQGDDGGGLSKEKVLDEIGRITIQQLNEKNEVVDSWTLHNPFPIEINYGELDYSSDETVEVSVTWKYDYAKFS